MTEPNIDHRGLPPVPCPTAPTPAPTPPTAAQPLLIVDDDESVRKFLTIVLRGLNHPTLACGSVTEALNLYQANSGRVAAVLLDLHLPGGQSGLDLLAELRRHNPQVRCCLMSGGSSDFTPEDLESVTGCPLLYKPFSVDVVTRAVRQLLEARPTAPADVAG